MRFRPPTLLKAATAALCLVVASPVSALMIQCDQCDEARMVQRLRDLAGAGLGLSGTVHVADFAGDVLRAFEVECQQWGWPRGSEPPLEGQRPGSGMRWWVCTRLTATPSAVQPAGAEQYAVLRAFYVDTGGTWQKQIVAPVLAEWQLGGPFGGHVRGFTAYDTAGDLNGRVLIGGALTHHCILCGLPAIGLLANALSSAVINASAAVIVTVRFHDGSTARYVFRFNEHWEFTYEPGSARTADGQLIPDVEALATTGYGSWYFGPGAGGDLIAYLERVRPGFVGPAPSGERYRLECTWDGSTLSCRILPP